MPAISDADAADGVGDDLHVGALDGQAVLGVRPQQQHDDGVGHQPRQRDDDHRHTGDLGRITESFEGLVEDERRDAEQQHRVGDGGEHPARCQPYVRAGDALPWRASSTAVRPMNIATRSVSMWPASASSASELISSAVVSSRTKKAVRIAAAMTIRLTRASALP